MSTFAPAYIILIRYKDDCKEQEEALALSFRTGTYRDGQDHHVLGEQG